MGISVVVPTMGRVTLKRMLDSLRPAGFMPAEDELIVVSHGHKNGAHKMFMEVGLPGKFLSIDRPDKPNLFDPSTPFNAGQDIATKPHISFIDDDDSYMPGAFQIIKSHVFDGLTIFQAISKEGKVIPPEPDPWHRYYPLTMVVARDKIARWKGGHSCDTHYGTEVVKNAICKRVHEAVARIHW